MTLAKTLHPAASWVVVHHWDDGVLSHRAASSGHWDTGALTEWSLLKNLEITELGLYNMV